MRITYFAPIAILALILAGCHTASPRGGGTMLEEEFRVVVPTYATEVKQGEMQTVSLSLTRGDHFKRDVKLEITAPKGLTVSPENFTIKDSAKPETQIRVSAAKDSAIGEYRIHVKAHPESGESTSCEFSIKVVAS